MRWINHHPYRDKEIDKIIQKAMLRPPEDEPVPLDEVVKMDVDIPNDTDRADDDE